MNPIKRRSILNKATGMYSQADVKYHDILTEAYEGTVRENRTGKDTRAAFGQTYTVDLQEAFPIITTKKVAFRAMVAEYLFFLTGDSHVLDLNHETLIWENWADDRGYLETSYGRYWRYYPLPTDPDIFVNQSKEEGVTYESIGVPPYEPFLNRDSKYVRKGPLGKPTFDQIRWLVDQLRENPESRRLHVQAWYPPNAVASKLPPCHHAFTVSTIGGRLNIHVHQRSGDLPLGVPFNMSGYALIANLLAKEVDMPVGKMLHTITDAHIYEDQMEGVKEQLEREPVAGSSPTLVMPDKSLFDLGVSDVEKFGIEDYNSRGRIRFPVAV